MPIKKLLREITKGNLLREITKRNYYGKLLREITKEITTGNY